jgi:hypothetical protein
MRYLILVFCLLLGAATPAAAQLSIGFSSPGLSIGINVPVYPRLVRVPGYPVYYAPGLDANFFFYDGLYWVFRDDRWYASSWYNGPWKVVDPYNVPLYVLRVPVRYYRRPPEYFHGWHRDAPPRWGEHWGHDWAERRRDWDHWDRRSAPRPAPLPRYQRNYSGDRYPKVDERQRELESRNYRYQPRDPDVRQHYMERGPDRGSARTPDRGSDRERNSDRRDERGRGR